MKIKEIKKLSADEIKNMKPRAKKKLLGKSFILKQEPYNPEEIYQLKALYEYIVWNAVVAIGNKSSTKWVHPWIPPTLE